MNSGYKSRKGCEKIAGYLSLRYNSLRGVCLLSVIFKSQKFSVSEGLRADLCFAQFPVVRCFAYVFCCVYLVIVVPSAAVRYVFFQKAVSAPRILCVDRFVYVRLGGARHFFLYFFLRFRSVRWSLGVSWHKC